MILLVLLASILIVGVTIYQYDEERKEYNKERFSRKEEAVISNFDFELKRQGLDSITTPKLVEVFQERIYEISSVHNLDITIFDLDGNLLKTSNTLNSFSNAPKTVLSQQILDDLETFPSHRVFSSVEMGNISNETSYNYITDLKFKSIAVIELKFSQDNSDQKRELKEFISRLAYVYAFMFMIAIVLAYFLSRYITKSLKTISDKINRTTLHKRNEKIEFSSASEEIATLVNAYNSMIDQLEESAARLAKSEREQAWREMAKQVAHEIKNPLTPMRLTVQSFERKFDPTDPKIKDKIKEYSQTLIQQIDVMTSIASAFSDFAKMPKQNKEPVDVVAVVKLALEIFNDSNINYESTASDIVANLDKTQLIRIVTNLVTNAQQAVESKENPEIKVTVTQDEHNVIISVEDNGKGISEAVKDLIFEPKFTTKSSGMGLGLGMIKKIIEAYNGSISFTSEENKGTIFTVTIPKT
ncbi:two-component sensor histidine kinase [Polaribacter pacificus]|uniref:histidine kinase n=1 Tax=Polaribacter pacificus TaxID=1775173 RepID=A0A917MCN3_9FLAO|nr:HAMP domain-containing sensor histidine kinase [Polaribacter pacificus]GGG94026.1 two-component sensor histidine kinase [Polaribacter pacificus]